MFSSFTLHRVYDIYLSPCLFLSFFKQTYPEEHIEEEEQVFDTTAYFCPFLRHCKLIADEKDNIISGEIFEEVCEQSGRASRRTIVAEPVSPRPVDHAKSITSMGDVFLAGRVLAGNLFNLQ